LESLKTVLSNYDLWRTSPELTRLFGAIEAMGVKEYVKYDPNITRGLLYYTGTVFEAFETSGSVKRAILGGGRYDNLLADVGGNPLPATGFAMGDVVIGIVLQEKGLIPEFNPSPASVLVTVFDQTLWMQSIALGSELRESGLNVVVYPEPVKLSKQYKYADKLKMKVAVTVGPDEAIKNQVAVKNLQNGEQVFIARNKAAGVIKRLITNA
jgi:histidyl-tRNA synthetase